MQGFRSRRSPTTRWSPTTARTRAASAPSRCGGRRRSSARSVAPIRSIGLASQAQSMLGNARRVTGRRWRRGRALVPGLPRADAGPEAEGDGAATSAGAGAVGRLNGSGSKGKWCTGRADNGSARDRWESIGGESSAEGSGAGLSGNSGGSGCRRAAEDQGGEGSSKRVAPDGDEEGSSGGGKRARGGKPGQCEHNWQRSRCKECTDFFGGGSIFQHARIRSKCKECGGGGICQHNRVRSQCKTCEADKDDSMPPDLEELD